MILTIKFQAQDTILFPNTTTRQTVKVTLGAENYFRLRLSNAFGTSDLNITQATVAQARDNASGDSAIEAHTLRKVTFDEGLENTTIVSGAQAVSDAVGFGFFLPANTVLSITGGNLADGLGPNLLGCLDRDILSHSGVRYVIVFEGVNDIGTAEFDDESQTIIGDRLIAAYRQVATRLHAHGIIVLAATITPFGRRKEDIAAEIAAEGLSGYSHSIRDRTRKRVNRWIHNSGIFDAVLEFSQLLEDKSDDGALKREFDSGDRLHPNTQAFKAIADAFPLGLFERF
ncbi:uncharacterized protein N7477_006203 [Penicillium maclennaniae]|uniref:uncharacterized protein n=1 Tax=Penicillium maclennaniae TaxID=1343394 RepID=UPI0025420969|nr:uncharacterized protein N7477_006203 [Penicillium maclennaniae]KAJ5670840.1 hypothetical protein N7477_006203 [Penicillium maclennaniae]